MFNRKFSSSIRLKRRMIRSTIILLVVCLGLGYSAFTTNLSIDGTLNVSKYDQTLYGVLEKAVGKGYAREYTGEHQDSMAGVGTKKIYHWWANNDTDGTAIQDKNNVIFADHCWQMIRTTDTGGVKMIYNGESEYEQCLNDRGNHVGYLSRTTQSMSASYYYGTSYMYDKNNNVFSLDGDVTTGTIQIGQYTCKQTTSTGTCTTLYLVDALESGTNYYVLQLNGNSNYSQFGILPFNQNRNSPAYSGYMYNKIYQVDNIYNKNEFSLLGYSKPILYYSDTIDYGNINPNKYTLINPQSTENISSGSELLGKYIIFNDTGISDTRVGYVFGTDGSGTYGVYFKQLINGDLIVSAMMGNSYTDNQNGTYTIQNPTEVTIADWYTGYSSYKGKYFCSGTNSTCSDIKHITSEVSNRYFYYFASSDNYKYSSSVSYSNGTYTLSGDIKDVWDISSSSGQNDIKTHHYTCFSNSTNCGSSVNYVNYYSNGLLYYVTLQDVNSIENAIYDMLNSDNVNAKNSVLKTGIDAWYKRYFSDYTSYLEDVIYCNDRSIQSLGGWANNGSITLTMYFNQGLSNNTNLSCTNTTDKFSLQNNKARLTYPVGLITVPELRLLQNSNIWKADVRYGLFGNNHYQPSSLYDMLQLYANYNGNITSTSINSTLGVRPAISLKPGTEYLYGTGSKENPYIVTLSSPN